MPDIREGDTLQPGMPVADVLDLSEVEVWAKVGELDRANLQGRPGCHAATGRHSRQALRRQDQGDERHGHLRCLQRRPVQEIRCDFFGGHAAAVDRRGDEAGRHRPHHGHGGSQCQEGDQRRRQSFRAASGGGRGRRCRRPDGAAAVAVARQRRRATRAALAVERRRAGGGCAGTRRRGFGNMSDDDRKKMADLRQKMQAASPERARKAAEADVGPDGQGGHRRWARDADGRRAGGQGGGWRRHLADRAVPVCRAADPIAALLRRASNVGGYTDEDRKNAKLPLPPEQDSQVQVLLRPGPAGRCRDSGRKAARCDPRSGAGRLPEERPVPGLRARQERQVRSRGRCNWSSRANP